MKMIFAIGLLATSLFLPLGSSAAHIGMMANLIVGNPENPFDPDYEQEWATFYQQLQQAKKEGVSSIAVDFWWGLIEPEKNQYRFQYFRRITDLIIKAGLKIEMNIATHRLGDNVGDRGTIDIPSYIWTEHIGEPGVPDANALKYKSEFGNYSTETVSAFGSQYIKPDLERLYRAIIQEFSDIAKHVIAISFSAGAAGELRYPSFNIHDRENGAHWPNRGALQIYSDLAIKSFQDFVRFKYNRNILTVNSAWSSELRRFEDITPPRPEELTDQYFANPSPYRSTYKNDLFEWQNSALLEHGWRIYSQGAEIFHSDESPFKHTRLGGKVPGIDWRMRFDRSAETTAGLIRPDLPGLKRSTFGHGYYHTVGLFRRLRYAYPESNFSMHFTALEKDDEAPDGPTGSQAKSQVFWVGQEAARQGVPIYGENALDFTMSSPKAWDNVIDALTWGHYQGIVLLRLNRLMPNPAAVAGLRRLSQYSCQKVF